MHNRPDRRRRAALGALSAAMTTLAAASPALAAPAETPAALDEVVVTARKREEDLQQTPISMTALSGASLAARQVASTAELDRVAPNLITSQGQGVSGNSSAGSYFIRGIGQIDFLLNTDPGVGVYLDGVYVARSLGSVLDLVDPERVEILRGPQGALFGRNTLGGAISVVSRPPSPTPRFEARGTVGSLALREGAVTLGGPLGATIAGELSVKLGRSHGWVERVTDGSRLGDDNRLAARGAVRWTPGDGAVVDLALDYTRQHGTSPPANVVQIVETANFPGFHNGARVGPPCVPPPGSRTNPACFNSQYEAGDLFKERGAFTSRQTLAVFGASLNAAWELSDGVSVRSITGFRRTKALGNRDGDHTPILIQNTTDTYKHEQVSQELQVAGKTASARLTWLLGAYGFAESGENLNFVTFPVVAIRSGGSIDNRSGAVFGQATYELTERLSLTGGLRYTAETKTFLPDQIVLADPTGAFPPGSTPGFRLVPFVESRRSIEELTPSASVAYRWTDRVLTYASYSEGFKSGGFTQRIFPPLPAPPPFRPEFAQAYEAGFKAETQDRRLRLNAAAYLTHYDDLQVQVLVGVQPLTANAAAARVSGFELELEAAPVPQLRITAGLGLTNARYTALDAGVRGTGVDLDSRFAQVPKWTANLGAAYTVPASAGDLTPRMDISYRSAAYMTAANTASLRQGAYALVNASLAYAPRGKAWRATVFARNLTDRAYFAGGFADLVDQGYAEAAIGRPRTWGLTLELSY